MEIFEIMDRESSNKSEIYLYEENGKWVAYAQSAISLLRNCKDTLDLKKQLYSFYGALTEKVEVDLNQILDRNWFVALCSDTEIMLIQTN